ncbi:hypothetical protein [Tsukamurella ocularis]|uniref:hypothetical protein n=1 Tax=Tsukamurella ocularis TaxID=1970234 RepID=UPI00216AA63A|nr:hypothetical protein [Tsukamurella ocularis]MCS3780295.1 hypothetical protein [Tsukamurella ocularis]MCS3786150.1 hypothetical protein [Tsukamurella ocularis]MCS3849514.1 hypothetical protein [Tsukamurella ocularis]
MSTWFANDIVGGGRLPLFSFCVGLIVGFMGIRVSVRLIRADVRWWFGNVKPGGLHLHHMVFGVVLCLGSAIGLIANFDKATQTTAAVLAGVFGLGAALILDEFALILYLRDVYWQEEGRASVDAVFVAIAMSGLLLLGLRPLDLVDFAGFRDSPERAAQISFGVISLGTAAIVLLKGKIWTGLLGLFFFPLLLIGAIRLSRPGAPWARWRYEQDSRRMLRALRRERRLRRPLIRAKIAVQDLMAGRPDLLPHLREDAEKELDRTVVPAPAPPRRPRSMARRLTISRNRRRSGTINRLPGLRATRAYPAAERPVGQEYEPVEPPRQ